MNELYKINDDADFDVIKKPIHFNENRGTYEEEIEIPNRYALINDVNKKPLGVVSNKYKIRRYKDLVYKVNDAIQEAGLDKKSITVKDWVHPKGTKFRRDVYFWDYTNFFYDGNPKEKAIPHLRIYSSYDSTWAEQIIFGSVYVLCMNGLVRPEWQFKVYNRHNSNTDISYTSDMFMSGFEAQKKLGAELFKLMQRKVTHTDVEHLFKHTLAKTQVNKLLHIHSDFAIRELGDLWTKYSAAYGSTMFAVYQTATHWSSHPITRGSTELVSRRREQKVINMMNSRNWLSLIGE